MLVSNELKIWTDEVKFVTAELIVVYGIETILCIFVDFFYVFAIVVDERLKRLILRRGPPVVVIRVRNT